MGSEQKPMHVGKYAKYVSPIKRRPGHQNPDGTWDQSFMSYDGYMARPPLTFDRSSYPESTVWVEILHAHHAGSGWGFPTPDNKGLVVPHYHEDCEETFIFFGTNCDDLDDLGGVVEFWMGAGDDAEKIILEKSASIVVPRGVPHSCVVFRKVEDPSKPIITIVVADTGDPAFMTEARLPAELPTNFETPQLFNSYYRGDKVRES